MLNKLVYNDYLAKKYNNPTLIRERLRMLDRLNDVIVKNGSKSLFDVTAKDIGDFAISFQWSMVEVKKAFEFLSEYGSFIRNEQPEFQAMSAAIEDYCLKRFEASGREAAASRKNTVLFIPDGVQIEPKHLGTLSNDRFVSMFRELQRIVIKAYENIEQSPFEWGYPDYYTTDGYYNRVFDFLYAFVYCADYADGTLTVDKKKFFSFAGVKKHKKPELMIAGFEKTGFHFDGVDKKSTFYSITYPANPHIITVLNAYVRGLGENALHWSAGEMCKWDFSYRFVEDPSAQKFETVFHSKMDLASEELKEIQYWLHDEAEKCGYRINTSHPYEKSCIQYQKGANSFLLVGEKDIDGVSTVFSKVIFRDAFNKENEKIMQLHRKFPNTFKSNCTLCNGSKPSDSKCSMRICYEIEGKPRRNCAYQSFLFLNPTFNDVVKLLELFKIENKIK